MPHNPRVTAAIGGHPLHAMVVPIPITCFIGAFLTDLAYWRTAEMQWANFSAWLITVGVIAAVLAALLGLVDFAFSRRIRELHPAWIHSLGNSLVLLLSIFNAFIHSRDAYTSVVPTGLILSGIVTVLLVVTGWNGWTMVHRDGVGVEGETP